MVEARPPSEPLVEVCFDVQRVAAGSGAWSQIRQLTNRNVLLILNGQTTPEGFHNSGRAPKGLTTKGVDVGTCGSCMDARGLTDADLAEGICRSSMTQRAEWTSRATRPSRSDQRLAHPD